MHLMGIPGLPYEECGCWDVDRYTCVECGHFGDRAVWMVDITSPYGTRWVDPVCTVCLRELRVQAAIDGEYVSARKLRGATRPAPDRAPADRRSRPPIDGEPR